MASNTKRPQLGAQRAPSTPKKRASGSGSADPNPLRFSLWFFFGFLIVVLDQATKFYFEHAMDPGDVIPVAPGFNFVLAHNRGAAFSFLANAGGWQRWFFTILAAAVVIFVLRLLWKHGGKRLFSLSLTLIAAGAAGNLIDRALAGYVSTSSTSTGRTGTGPPSMSPTLRSARAPPALCSTSSSAWRGTASKRAFIGCLSPCFSPPGCNAIGRLHFSDNVLFPNSDARRRMRRMPSVHSRKGFTS